MAVFVVFGLIAAESKSAREYVGEVRNGGANRRWQAAFELSKVIQAKKDPALHDPKFVDELVTLFDDAEDDPRVRRYPALRARHWRQAYGCLRSRVETTDLTPTRNPDYVICARRDGDPLAVPQLVQLGGRGPGRKAAVHALARSEREARPRSSRRSRTPPRRALNAALALAGAAIRGGAGSRRNADARRSKDQGSSPEQRRGAARGGRAAASLKDAS